MKEKLGKDTVDFKFFQDFWTFYQMYNGVEPENDGYWNNLIRVSDQLAAKYKDTEINQMVREILMARLKHLERKAAKINEEGATVRN